MELSTRKIAIPFDIENDVIDEVYDSWYNFFSTARELLKEDGIITEEEFNQKKKQLLEL